MIRYALGLAGALVAVAAVAGPAAAVGTGGVEFTPDPAVERDGRTVTAFHVDLPGGGERVERYTLRNLTDKPVTVRLYAAAANRSATGAYAVAGPGSAPWIELADRTQTLAPRAELKGTFTVRPADRAGEVYGAVVLERASASVVTRAATLVYLNSDGPSGPARTLPVLVAAALAAGAGVATAVRRKAARS